MKQVSGFPRFGDCGCEFPLFVLVLMDSSSRGGFWFPHIHSSRQGKLPQVRRLRCPFLLLAACLPLLFRCPPDARCSLSAALHYCPLPSTRARCPIARPSCATDRARRSFPSVTLRADLCACRARHDEPRREPRRAAARRLHHRRPVPRAVARARVPRVAAAPAASLGNVFDPIDPIQPTKL